MFCKNISPLLYSVLVLKRLLQADFVLLEQNQASRSLAALNHAPLNPSHVTFRLMGTGSFLSCCTQ